MQVLGASSLLVSLVAMFLYYLEWNVAGGVVFGVGMVLLALSLCVCIWEIQISVKALNLSSSPSVVSAVAHFVSAR